MKITTSGLLDLASCYLNFTRTHVNTDAQTEHLRTECLQHHANRRKNWKLYELPSGQLVHITLKHYKWH